jgi:hypothetical protein
LKTRSPTLTLNKPLTFVPVAERQALGTPEAGAGSVTFLYALHGFIIGHRSELVSVVSYVHPD